MVNVTLNIETTSHQPIADCLRHLLDLLEKETQALVDNQLGQQHIRFDVQYCELGYQNLLRRPRPILHRASKRQRPKDFLKAETSVHSLSQIGLESGVQLQRSILDLYPMQHGWRQRWHVRLMDYPKIFLAGLAEPTFLARKDAKALSNSIIRHPPDDRPVEIEFCANWQF